MRMVNFAHADFITGAGYALLAVGVTAGWLIVPLALLAGAVLALVVERTAFRPVRNADMPTLLIASFAASAVIQNLLILFVGSTPRSVDVLGSLSNSRLTVSGVNIGALDFVTIGISWLLLAILVVCLYRTNIGLQLRAAAENFDAARLLGVRANVVVAAAFTITGLLAGATAVLLLARTGALDPTLGLQLTLVGFVATIVGGMGSLLGAVIGAYVLGILTVVLQTTLPASTQGYRDAFVFGAVVVMLVLWPRGLFAARSTVERV
jgi:branched-chain amino acid transport system permease protein